MSYYIDFKCKKVDNFADAMIQAHEMMKTITVDDVRTLVDEYYSSDRDFHRINHFRNAMSTIKFAYNKEHKILCVMNYFSKHIKDDSLTFISFQNSCDRDNDYETWGFFNDMFKEDIDLIKSKTIEDYKGKFDEDEYIEDTCLCYLQKTEVHDFLFEKLDIDNLLWDNLDNWEVFCLQKYLTEKERFDILNSFIDYIDKRNERLKKDKEVN